MDVAALKQLVKEIVKDAVGLKNRHTSEKNAPVNYACIFAQGKEQYNNLLVVAQKIGVVLEETPTGPVFHIQPINTVAGNLWLLKIRKPDATRPELGDADFTVENYSEFKKRYSSRTGFKLIPRENFEMIELVDPSFNVRAYFSNPPLNEQLKIE
ncbi:MAG: hypothetical protein JW834_05020 [Candidatus Diapherotrites archaeon]|nr:hypothetical protein [Candidatus Diapherotrites archaeon]